MKQWIAVLLTLTLLLTPMTAAAQTESDTPPVENDLATTPVIMGDVSRNGNIGAEDALRVLKSCVGKISFDPHDHYNDAPGAGIAADVDGDGHINAADALQILQKVVGKIDRFPVDAALYGQDLTLTTLNADLYTTEPYASFIDKLEQQYGMTLTVLPLPDDLEAKFSAGTLVGDVIETPNWYARDLGRAGYLVNLADQRLQLLANSLTASTGVGKYKYGVGFQIAEGSIRGIFYNKDRLKQVAPDYDLNTMYTQGKWDLSAFRQLAALATQDTDADGKNDVYGITANSHLIEMALEANGGMTKEKNGRMVERLSENADLIATLKEIHNTDKSWLYKADVFQCIDQFNNENALMFATYLAFGKDYVLGETDFEVGFIPMPKTDGSLYQFTSSIGVVFAVPKGKEDKAAAAVALAVQLHMLDFCTTAALQEEYPALGLDQDSVQWAVQLQNVDRVDPAFHVLNLFDGLTSAVVTNTPVETKWATTAQKQLDDYYAPFYE